ncbi:MAG: hypothetical protein ACREM3_25855 [Candidatus Rokuibacteriota bacterium]
MVKSMTVSLSLALALIAAPAPAQQVDVAGEQQLGAAGQTIDANAAKVGSGRATSKIVEQWKGTSFMFDPDGTPRELTAQDVQDYRAKGLGYGEISILLALTARQEGTSPMSVNEILAMRQTEKMGWGNIARALDYKSLGEVQKAVKATDARVQREAKTTEARPEKAARVDRMGRPDKVERPEKVEKIQRMERVEKVERKAR